MTGVKPMHLNQSALKVATMKTLTVRECLLNHEVLITFSWSYTFYKTPNLPFETAKNKRLDVQGVFSSEVISFPKLMRANCRIPIFVRLIFGTGLLKVVKIHFRFSFQSVQLSTIFIWNTDDSVQDLGAYLMNWVALYFNLSNWGPFSRKNNYEIAKSFCKMKVYLLFLTLWRAKLLIIQIINGVSFL